MSKLANSLTTIKTHATINSSCPVQRLYSQLDDEDRQALQSALQSVASTRSIHAALRGEGYSIDRTSIALHRDNRCKCTKQTKQNASNKENNQ